MPKIQNLKIISKIFLKENYHKINKPKQIVIFLKKSFLIIKYLAKYDVDTNIKNKTLKKTISLMFR